jgi:hypothetical protein
MLFIFKKMENVFVESTLINDKFDSILSGSVVVKFEWLQRLGV